MAVHAWIENWEDALLTYGEIGDWDTGMLTDMSYLFASTGFNRDISRWKEWQYG